MHKNRLEILLNIPVLTFDSVKNGSVNRILQLFKGNRLTEMPENIKNRTKNSG